MGPAFVQNQEARGKRLMSPASCVEFHPFTGTLQEWEAGVPVDCGDDWAWETVVAAVDKGPHKSVTSTESIALVAEDVAYQVQAGYAEVISWEELKKSRPRNLKISPLPSSPNATAGDV